MSLKSKLYTFVNRVVTIKSDINYGEIIKYDTDNKFPQNLVNQIRESGTATSCVEALNQYTFAEGLVDKELGNTLVNDTQTFNDLIEDIIQQLVVFEGDTLHISRDSSGNPISIKVIPFENTRKLEGECLVYNHTLSSRYDSSKDCKYPPFKGAKINQNDLSEILQFKNKEGEPVGEILYFFKRKPLQYIYPIPSYYSSISDIDTDAENSKYELESVTNSFLPSGIFTIVGEVDDESKDEHGKTEWDDYNDTLEAFTGNKKDIKGETGRQKLAVFHAKTKEEIPTYQQINNEGILTAIDLSTIRVANKVTRAFGVPPFIIGLGGNVGFATNIISDNITLFNNRITKIQKLVSTQLNMIFPDKDFTMTQLTPIKYLDPSILAVLTPDEKRELAGYKPLNINTNVLPTVNNQI